VCLRKEEASSETSCILLVGTVEKVAEEVCEVSDKGICTWFFSSL
jgi:hypothetical protein